MAVGVRSSSSKRSSLRSISSRRRRISEVLEGHDITAARGPGRRGACPARALVGRADQTRPLHSAVVREVCCFLCFSHVTFRPILLSRFGPVLRFVRSTPKICSLEPTARQGGLLAPPHCWLTNKIKAPAAINRASRIPATSAITQCRLGLTSFDLAPFCAAPRPNQKRSLFIAVSAVIGAALWRPYYACDCGELARSASAKSPNPGQGYLARRPHER